MPLSLLFNLGTTTPLGRFFCFSGFFFLQTASVWAVELSVRNELHKQDEAPMVFINQGRSAESPKSIFNSPVHPGFTVKITKGNVTNFVLVRPFPGHKLKYEVFCPADSKGTATITLTDIHNNALPHGCYVDRFGHWSKRTGMKWVRVKRDELTQP